MIFWWCLAPTSGVFQSIPKVTTSGGRFKISCQVAACTASWPRSGRIHWAPRLPAPLQKELIYMSSYVCLQSSSGIRHLCRRMVQKKRVLSARIRNDQYSVIVLNKNLLVVFLFLFLFLFLCFFFFFFLFLLLLLFLLMTGTSLLAQMSFKVANERIRLLKRVKAFWLHMLSLTMSGLAIKMTQSSKQPTTKWQSEPAGMKRW